MSTSRIQIRLNIKKEARRRAKESIGLPPPTKKIPDKRFKTPKYGYRDRPDYDEE